MTNTITTITTAAQALCDFASSDLDDVDALSNLHAAEDQLMEVMREMVAIHPLRPLAAAIAELIENEIH